MTPVGLRRRHRGRWRGLARPAGQPSGPSRRSARAMAAYRLDAATEASLSPARAHQAHGTRSGDGDSSPSSAPSQLRRGCEPPARGGGTAVSVGTAWAEEGDEIIFLDTLIKLGEKAAKPAFFVNSVKNALASQLALTFGFQGENQTFAHDALSFESALWQGAQFCAPAALGTQSFVASMP